MSVFNGQHPRDVVSCECHQGRNRRRHRRNEKVAAAAWLMGAGVLCLILWAIILKAVVE